MSISTTKAKQSGQDVNILTDNVLFVLSCVLAVAFFVLDYILPLGVAGGVPYIAAVMFGLWYPNKRLVVTITLICVALIFIGFYISPAGGEVWKVYANRALAVFAVVITGTIIYIAKIRVDDLGRSLAKIERGSSLAHIEVDPISVTGLRGLVVAFPILLMIIGAAFWINAESKGARLLVSHTNDVKISLSSILSALQDAETGQRGFLLTGDEKYLEPFVWSTAKLDDIMSNLKDLTSYGRIWCLNI